MMKLKMLLSCTFFLLCVSFYKCENWNADFDDFLVNPYRELRLPPWSSMRDIKNKYNEMVKKYHPDKNKKEGSQEKFMKVQKAYEKLKEIRKVEKDEDEDDVEDPFFLAIQETFQLCAIVVILMALIYGLFWVVFKMYQFMWLYVLYFTIPFIIIDKLFPHYFINMKNQYIASIMCSVLLFYGSKIYNYIKGFICQKKDKTDSEKKSD